MEFHRGHGKKATLTAVLQEQGKGVLDIQRDGAVHSFREKKKTDGVPINAGYMVLEPDVFDLIDGDNVSFENEPLELLVNKGELMSYVHRGFWQCMDTLREQKLLEHLWEQDMAPWKKWDE